MNIIADIAGQYDTLLALLKKMPQEKEIISLGDMVDRGPKSRQVIEWFMKNGKAILGNHEHMMLNYCRGQNYYDRDTWQWNGGTKTLESYGFDVPEEHLTWIEHLPKFIEVDNVLLSHSFLHETYKNVKESIDFGENAMSYDCDRCLIWNRDEPVRHPQYRLQVCGHNSQFGLRRWSDDKGEYAICLDDCRKKVLTGLHLETMTIYQQEYI